MPVEQPRVSDKPETLVLLQNYPNPFNPSTSIEYILPQSGLVPLEIYNIRGEIVEVLVNRYCESGAICATQDEPQRENSFSSISLSFL